MKRLTILLLIFSVGAVLIKIAPVFVFGFKVIGGGLCPNDFLDILIWAPFIVVMFFFITKDISSEAGGVGTSVLLLLILLGAAFFEGHGIHFSANAIHNMLSGETVGQGFSDLIYFYDELLGHWITDVGFFGILGVLFLVELRAKDKKKQKTSTGELISLIIAAILFGFYAGSAALESQTAPEVLIYFIAIIVIFALASLFGKRELKKQRLGLFMCGAGLVVTIAYIIYWIIFGGLIEPSQWM